jgi:hypothetical protein
MEMSDNLHIEKWDYWHDGQVGAYATLYITRDNGKVVFIDSSDLTDRGRIQAGMCGSSNEEIIANFKRYKTIYPLQGEA